MKSFDYPISLGKGLRLRPVEREEIEATHLINLRRPVPHDVYLWSYFDNPFRQGRPTGWVVEHDEHGLCGKIWLTWWQARFRGQPILCTIGGDLYVDPRLRGMGAGAGLVGHQFECFPEGLVLGASANENSMFFWRKFGGFTVAGGNVRHQRFVSAAGALRGTAAGLPPLRRLLQPLVRNAGRRAPAPAPSSGRGWRLADLGDPKLLAFLEETERQVDITTRRDETFLRWRYEGCPVHEPRVLVTEGRSGINGFLAMQVRARQARLDLRVAEVIDFMLDFEDPEARRAVADASLDWARTHGAHLLEWRGSHPALPRLFESGRWLRRESEINPFVCWSAQSEALDLRSRSFHLVLAEGDAAVR